jgi:hypothetical protein
MGVLVVAVGYWCRGVGCIKLAVQWTVELDLKRRKEADILERAIQHNHHS